MAMTLRQRILKSIYPFFIKSQQMGTKELLLQNKEMIAPPVSFYSLSVLLNNGNEFPFEKLKGRKVLLVNTASNCGYTAQYAELQKLYQHAKEDMEIIAFPANDFKEQEKGSDEEIARFCSLQYGVSFLIAKKAVVMKEKTQHPVYQWLTHQRLNGWNGKAPSWNFAKYLVNEKGILTHCFEPSVSPLSPAVMQAVRA